MKAGKGRLFFNSITKHQAKDSGMAAVLILLLAGILTKDVLYFQIGAGALLMDMIFPMFFWPFAVVWFGISRLMGAVVSRVVLVVVYLLVVLPVALVRRLMGKDTLLLKQFKKDNSSVMKARDHSYNAADLEKPF